jgi:NAD(P)H-hydrate epimerase
LTPGDGSKKATELNVVIVLKGHHTFIHAGGQGYFNSTGNAGMATGGSGDVLTGIITSLVAQNIHPDSGLLACIYTACRRPRCWLQIAGGTHGIGYY